MSKLIIISGMKFSQEDKKKYNIKDKDIFVRLILNKKPLSTNQIKKAFKIYSKLCLSKEEIEEIDMITRGKSNKKVSPIFNVVKRYRE